jgi:hypothetical protein
MMENHAADIPDHIDDALAQAKADPNRVKVQQIAHLA